MIKTWSSNSAPSSVSQLKWACTSLFTAGVTTTLDKYKFFLLLELQQHWTNTSLFYCWSYNNTGQIQVYFTARVTTTLDKNNFFFDYKDLQEKKIKSYFEIIIKIIIKSGPTMTVMRFLKCGCNLSPDLNF